MRRRPRGGLVVRAPDPRGAATALVIYLEYIGTSVADLMDVRLVLEPLAVRLTTERLSEEAITVLRTAAEEEATLTSDGPLAKLPDRLHPAIAHVCGNAVLRLFLEVLSDLSEHFAARPRRMTLQETARIDARVRAQHREIAEAITGGDGGKAQHLITEHLFETRDLLLATSRNRKAWSGIGDRRSGRTGKLAERIAEQIRTDLARQGAAAGDVVGSEDEVRERYQVSRQVLREAVRLLEHHGVARMQRGPGGGLVVSEPDPWASIEAIAVYLNYQQMDIADLRAVRVAVELACVDRVVARRDEPGVSARLRQAVDFDETASLDELKAHVHEVHREFARLSGNPVLELFFCVLASLWERHGLPSPRASPLNDREILRTVKAAHTSIVDAVLHGDAEVARHRMTRHLDALTAWWQ
jgi:DNA-binding FadR family transcriptional regulator